MLKSYLIKRRTGCGVEKKKNKRNWQEDDVFALCAVWGQMLWALLQLSERLGCVGGAEAHLVSSNHPGEQQKETEKVR